MFITAVRAEESSILNELSTQPLVFKTLDGEVAAVVKTDLPWTHERLTALDLSSILGQNFSDVGYDAYVGDTWVGSTEV